MAPAMVANVAARSSLRRLTLGAGKSSRILQNRVHCFSTVSSSINPFHPKLSQQSQYRKEVSLANLFQRYGFPPSQIQGFLAKNRFLLNSKLQELEKCLATLLSFRIPQNSLISLIRDCPGLLEHQFLKKWEACFSQLHVLTPSPLMIRNFLRYSRRYQLDPGELSKSIEILRGLGFTHVAVARVFEDFPTVVVMNKGEILSVIEFLMEIGVPRDKIDRVISLHPRVLGLGIEDRLKPLLRELSDLGFCDDEIIKEIIREPKILGMELGEFSRCFQLLKTLKCREPIKEKIFQEGTLRAGFEVKLRLDCLCSHGLIRRDAFKVLWKEPRLITYDLENIEKKIDFLVHRMEYSVDCLPDVPEYLGVNFEKQIVPRYSVMEYLKAKGAIDFDVRLKDLIKPSRLRFYNLYVKPFPECEKLYGRYSGNVEVKSKHPTGLWKIFKPRKYPETNEDVKNIKSFMDGVV